MHIYMVFHILVHNIKTFCIKNTIVYNIVSDSVIFVGPRDLKLETVKCGDALGDLTDELSPGEYITEFVSGGAKNYAFTTSKSRVQTTVKGITLNSRNADVVNFETVKAMVLGNGPSEVKVIDPLTFVRNPIAASIESSPREKTYRIVYTKRRLLDDGISTLPFGYCD